MFGWGALAPPPEELLQKERLAIPRPTEVQFPSHRPDLRSHPLSQKRSQALRSSIARLRHPNDVSTTQLEHLNISITQDVPMSDFVPTDFLEERPYLYDDELTSMLNELRTDNSDAFREVLRLPPNPGRKKPKLAYSRGFFQGLDDMARYWDDSMDNYYHIPDDRLQAEDKPSESKDGLDEKAETGDVEMTDFKDISNHQSADQSSDTNLDTSPGQHSSTTDAIAKPMKEVYRGVRVGSGAQMPPGTRIATLRNLVKMATHKFQCRDHDLSNRERLCVNKIKIPGGNGSGPFAQGIGAPLRPSFVVARLPRETKAARERKVEGPLMAGWARSETKFAAAKEVETSAGGACRRVRGEDEATETWDLFREIGCLLVLACMRNREGATEEVARQKMLKQGQERWWETKPRWGNGPTKWGNLPSELFEDEDPSCSPEERKLLEAKRAKSEQEKQKTEQAKNPLDLNVDDLLASGGPQGGSSAFDTGSSNGSTSTLTDLSRPTKKSKTSPTEPTAPVEPNNNKAVKDRNKSRHKEKEEVAEYRDGRRLVSLPAVKKKWYQDWLKMKPNVNTWDDKVIWRKIGRPDDANEGGGGVGTTDVGTWDEVYMLSSVNHHVCLMKMRANQAYLRWLEDGSPLRTSTALLSTSTKQDNESKQDTSAIETQQGDQHAKTSNAEQRDSPKEQANSNPAVLYVQRSQWFDLFDIEERCDLLTGLWRVMSWLNRDEVPKEEWEKIKRTEKEVN